MRPTEKLLIATFRPETFSRLLACAAHLTTSPVVFDLLKIRRKAENARRVESGGRARVSLVFLPVPVRCTVKPLEREDPGQATVDQS